MQNVFNITTVTPDYSNKQIVIQTNFRVDKDTVTKKNVSVTSAESGITVVYKLSVDEDKIIITLKDWPDLSTYYVVKVNKIKDMLNRDLVNPLSKDIYFKSETKLKCIIDSPKNNEAVKEQHKLVYFSIKQVNPDGTLVSHPMPEPIHPELPSDDSESELTSKEAVLEDESDIMYHFEFASDTAFFDIVKDYQTNYTDGYITLDNAQYYMRARVVQNGMQGDWSDVITFTVIPDTCACTEELEQAKQEYLDDIFAPVDFFINGTDEPFEIISCSENGVTFPEFFIELSKEIDEEKLPETLIAYRRDL